MLLVQLELPVVDILSVAALAAAFVVPGTIEAVKKPRLKIVPVQPELATERIKTARSRWRWMRDFSAAAIVGGATVALTLMLGGLPVWQDEFIALEVIYGLLVIGTWMFWRMARTSTGLSVSRVFDNGLLAGGFIIEVGVQTGLSGHWPIEAHTGLWWNFIATALAVTISGAMRRHIAETHLEDLGG
jgi:hypothetical protein